MATSRTYSMSQSLEHCLQQHAERVESALDRVLPSAHHPTRLHEAMRYAVLGSGKRIRPVLTLLIHEMLGGTGEEIMLPACSVELIHSYSLIHDDLPCLDNDEYRRGKLTCHKKFGEAMALLAGDGLLTLAFNLLGQLTDPIKTRRILRELSLSAGTHGMVGGQAMDVVSEGVEMDLPTLEAIHVNKTGQMIKASCHIGALMASIDEQKEHHILRFGEYLGFAFQIVDDILDGDGYLRFMSVHEARDKAEDIISRAKIEIQEFKNNARLIEVSDYILNRTK
jgi:geranylgeranyl diphosphate synthase, type II